MARPIFDQLQYLEGWNLYKHGMGPAGIQRWLEKKHPDDPASLRTVKNWIKKYAAVAQDDPSPDDDFEWHRLDDYLLPWDSSRYLLTMCQFHGAWSSLRPTFRHAVWWWRVHQALPSAAPYDVWAIADHFVLRQLANALLGIKLTLGDLEAWLSCQPWIDEAHLQAYLRDVTKGVIPPLLDPREMIGLRRRLPDHSEGEIRDWMHLAFVSSTFPGTLPSQWLKELAEDKREDADKQETQGENQQ